MPVFPVNGETAAPAVHGQAGAPSPAPNYNLTFLVPKLQLGNQNNSTILIFFIDLQPFMLTYGFLYI